MNRGVIEQIGTPDEVYEHPANPFVLNFLGAVNLFHGRTERTSEASVVSYVRPHDLEIVRHVAASDDAVAAVVRHIHAVGPTIRIELLRTDTDSPIEAELTREQFKIDPFHAGDPVFVKPRLLQVFAGDDYSI